MKAVFLAVMLVVKMQAYGQAMITGLVADEKHQPVSYCSIVLCTADSIVVTGAYTDSLGRFRLMDVDKGRRYFVSASMVGYAPYHTAAFSVDTNSGIYEVPVIVLTKSVANLDGVVVSAKKKLFEMHADKMVMNVENSILARGNSAFEVVKRAPGVTTDKDDNILLKGSACQVFINGKSAHLGGGMLTSYLKALPADAVSKIEIISNPSSRFDAQGSGGIINIRLKNSKKSGLNGTANCGLGYGKYPKENAGMNMNYRKDKIGIFGNGYIGHSESYNRLTYNTAINNTGNYTYQDRSQYWHPFATWGSYMAGTDYSVGKNSVLGFLINGSGEGTKAQTDNNTVVSGTSRIPQQYISVLRNDTSETTNKSYNINFKTTMDSIGSELSFDADYARYDGSSVSHNNNVFSDASNNEIRRPYVFRNTQPSAIDILSAKADLIFHFKNRLKLEAGSKASKVKTDNNLLADSMKDGAWVADYNRSNHFIYSESILAAYVTASRDFGQTSVQAGLRAEQTVSTGRSMTLGTNQARMYLGLFPTLFITRPIDSSNQLNFSYTRRIQRPRYQSLNPFTLYIDPFTLFEGNPYLKPEYAHSMEIKHSYRELLFTSLSYKYATGPEVEAIFQNAATGITTNTPRNSSTSGALFLGVMASLNFNRIWSCDINTNIGYGRDRSSIPGFSFYTTSFGADFSSSHTFVLPRSYKVQTSIYYSIPVRSGLAHLRSDYAWDAGIQKQIWKAKATIKLNFTSIVGPTAYRARISNNQLNVKWENKWEGRKASFSFVWKFGNNQLKGNREHATSLQDEKRRVK